MAMAMPDAHHDSGPEQAPRIDWEAFTRYSSEPWVTFVEGRGSQEGEFRLYARVSRSQTTEDVLGLIFHPWRDQATEGYRYRSPTVVVERDSVSGRRLEQILAADEAQSDRWEVNDSIFPTLDPPGCHRVRVRLVWDDNDDGDRALRVGEVLAGNWLGLGFEDLERARDESAPAAPDPQVAGNGKHD